MQISVVFIKDLTQTEYSGVLRALHPHTWYVTHNAHDGVLTLL